MTNRYQTGLLKNVYHLLFFLPLLLILYACPYSSPYKLDQEPSLNTDDALLGKWATMVTTKKGAVLPVKMIIGKKNDTEYNIDFAGYLDDLRPFRIVDNDSIKGTAYASNVANRNFLNISIRDQVYIAEFSFTDNKLSLLPLAEQFTAKYIKSNAELRLAVEVHIKNRSRPMYDEPFCLRDMVRVN